MARLLLAVVVVAVPGVSAEVLPGADVVAVDPGNLGEVAFGQTDSDLADVVGVVVNLPFPAPAGDG
ncbi:hypothetical protein GCM10018980_72390 [Streptomyces capoamus]|uniref:Uncharacterized protein n=1 Tax=Streptomyces capoamus TaxID=68183 RepID=A0A919F352_9ACTN|nr:hypothetical protein GCM10010501_17030 [Streptomyces libani subsp. rufus]GHG75083.1 hypothetical protein GCM10018980_72390 [Streptomyces capoamus]